jgi:hypothetical protein
MWKSLYDTLLQWFTSPWAEYLNTNANQGRLVRAMFFNDIYQYSGIILFLICFISCLLYYFYFNKLFGKYYKRRTWLIWMIFTSLLVGLLTFIIGYPALTSFISPTTHLIAWLSVINFIYSLILFFITSIIFQLTAILVRRIFSYDLSPMASRTPF